MDILTHRLKLSTVPSIGAPGLFFEFARALPLRVQAAVFTDAAIASLTGLVSVTMMVRVSQDDTASAALMSKTVAAEDFESCTTSQWLARTHQQITFEFTAAECNLTLDGSKTKFWLVFKGLLDDGSELLLGSGWATCVESNATAAGDPPDNPEPGISGPAAAALVAATQIDLRVNDTHVQWKRANQGAWTDLIALTTLTGAPGTNGTDGANPELQVSGNWLQWRLVGASTWSNLFDLSTLGGLETPVAVAHGGTGADNAAAARINLGIESLVPAVAQVTELSFSGASDGSYIDIPVSSTAIVRAWWNVDSGGNAPAAPSEGVLIAMGVTAGVTVDDAAQALTTAVHGVLGLTASRSVNMVTLTQPAGVMPPVDASYSGGSCSAATTITGVDAYRRLLSSRADVLQLLDQAIGSMGYFDGNIWRALVPTAFSQFARLSVGSVPELVEPESVQFARLANDSSLTSTALANILTVPLKAYGRYLVFAFGPHTSNTTTEGMYVSLNASVAPSSVVFGSVNFIGINTLNAVNVGTAYNAIAAGALTGPGTTARPFILFGFVENGGADTDLYLRAATETGGSNSSVVKAGTVLVAIPLSPF